MNNWTIIKADTYPGHKEKKFGKKHRNLVFNLFENLQKYFELLEEGEHPEQLKRYLSFVHDEKRGLYAIDQRPPVKGFQLRLYIYPDISNQNLHILIVGDKNSQKDDIKLAQKAIKELQNG